MTQRNNTDNGNGEVEVSGPMGIRARARGYRLLDLVCVVALFVAGYTALVLAQHRDEAREGIAVITRSLEAQQAELVRLNQQQLDELRRHSELQRRHTDTVRELVCLMIVPQDRRQQHVEVCRRVAREGQ